MMGLTDRVRSELQGNDGQVDHAQVRRAIHLRPVSVRAGGGLTAIPSDSGRRRRPCLSVASSTRPRCLFGVSECASQGLGGLRYVVSIVLLIQSADE
jgi:hypothetical protein